MYAWWEQNDGGLINPILPMFSIALMITAPGCKIVAHVNS